MFTRTILIVVVCVCMAGFRAGAQPKSQPPASDGLPTFKSASANDAVAKHAAAVTAAEAAYAKVAGAARADLNKSLELARTVAVRSRDTAQADTLQRLIDTPDPSDTNWSALLKSAAARQALAKWGQANSTARFQRDETVGTAAAELVRALEAAKAAATTAGDAQEIAALQAMIDQRQPGPSQFDFGGADRVVFIGQATGTMTYRMPALKHELMKALTELKPTQSYNVLFFTDGGKVMVASLRGLLPGNSANKRQTVSFLETVVPTGTTNPVPAIEAAFKQKPQVIYFMANGEFNNLASHAEVVAAFKRLNVGQAVKVHAVHFPTSDAKATKAMKEIAEGNGGSYREVKSKGD